MSRRSRPSVLPLSWSRLYIHCSAKETFGRTRWMGDRCKEVVRKSSMGELKRSRVERLCGWSEDTVLYSIRASRRVQIWKPEILLGIVLYSICVKFRKQSRASRASKAKKTQPTPFAPVIRPSLFIYPIFSHMVSSFVTPFCQQPKTKKKKK